MKTTLVWFENVERIPREMLKWTPPQRESEKGDLRLR